MPSQEKDLDGLLRELSETDREETVRQGDAGEGDGPDIDDVSGMSEEEIARLLAAGAESGRQSRGGVSEDMTPGDILDSEDVDGDGNLREIQELLKKSDRNETIEARPEEPSQGMGPADRLFEEIEAGRTDVATDSKKQKALEKKRLKEERAAAKKAAKEAAKAEKAARRGLKGKQKEEQEDTLSQKGEQVKEFDMLLDKDLLDSIVSGAGQVEHESSRRKTDAAVRHEEPDEEEEELEPEVLTLDLEEAAAYIPNVPKAERDGQEGEASKKKGLISKVVNLLMEEEEEEEGRPKRENENIQISAENQEIINALDGESAGKSKSTGAKKKKAKPAKKKKDTKAKKAKSKPKPKKPKKAKEPEPYIPGSKITFKKALPILLLGFTVGAVTFLFVNLTVDFTGKQAARRAYDAGDYHGCYLSLYGKKLNENEKAMYGKSESILYMNLWEQEYKLLAENGTDAEALDCLLQIINDYPKLYERALQWNAVPEIYEVYSQLLGILNEKYGLTEAQAREIAAIKSDIEYTKAVYAVAEGKVYGVSGAQGTTQTVQPDVPGSDSETDGEEIEDGQSESGQPDELPEESEIESGNFVDNQS